MLLLQRGRAGDVRERTLVVMLQTLLDLPSTTIVIVSLRGTHEKM